MASEPVARSEAFMVFIPELERLFAEVMEEWKSRVSPLLSCKTGRWRSSGPMAFAMSKPA